MSRLCEDNCPEGPPPNADATTATAQYRGASRALQDASEHTAGFSQMLWRIAQMFPGKELRVIRQVVPRCDATSKEYKKRHAIPVSARVQGPPSTAHHSSLPVRPCSHGPVQNLPPTAGPFPRAGLPATCSIERPTGLAHKQGKGLAATCDCATLAALHLPADSIPASGLRAQNGAHPRTSLLPS